MKNIISIFCSSIALLTIALHANPIEEISPEIPQQLQQIVAPIKPSKPQKKITLFAELKGYFCSTAPEQKKALRKKIIMGSAIIAGIIGVGSATTATIIFLIRKKSNSQKQPDDIQDEQAITLSKSQQDQLKNKLYFSVLGNHTEVAQQTLDRINSYLFKDEVHDPSLTFAMPYNGRYIEANLLTIAAVNKNEQVADILLAGGIQPKLTEGISFDSNDPIIHKIQGLNPLSPKKRHSITKNSQDSP